MSQPILEAILEAMELQSDEMHGYLHRPTGRALVISDEALAAAENDDRNWVSPEELEEARAILASKDEYLEVPDRFEINEYRMMEGFAGTLEDHEQGAAFDALRGRGAFRRFKDTMHRLGKIDAWYAYRNDCYRRVAIEWCEANGISPESPTTS